MILDLEKLEATRFIEQHLDSWEFEEKEKRSLNWFKDGSICRLNYQLIHMILAGMALQCNMMRLSEAELQDLLCKHHSSSLDKVDFLWDHSAERVQLHTASSYSLVIQTCLAFMSSQMSCVRYIIQNTCCKLHNRCRNKSLNSISTPELPFIVVAPAIDAAEL